MQWRNRADKTCGYYVTSLHCHVCGFYTMFRVYIRLRVLMRYYFRRKRTLDTMLTLPELNMPRSSNLLSHQFRYV